LKYLLERPDASTDDWLKNEDNSRGTPLALAAFHGQVAAIDLLYLYGADQNAKDGDGNTPLHQAALGGQREAVLKLSHLGAKISATNKKGDTPRKLGRPHRLDALIGNLESKSGCDGSFLPDYAAYPPRVSCS